MGILYVIAIVGAAVLYLYLSSPTVIGAAGERKVNSTLRSALPEADYFILEDLTLPTDTGTTQVDHIVVSRFGIFVIETKNMSGWIFGGERQAKWTQVIRRHKSQFQNPLRQNYHHVKVVQEILGIHQDQIDNLVVFVGDATPKTEMPSSVFWGRRKLAQYISAQRIPQFSEEQVRGFLTQLRSRALKAGKETKRAHVQHLKQKSSNRKASPAPCPRCGATMSQRTNKRTGQLFWGCSRFPKCKGTRKAA